jgi:RNA polymerase sigma factor (sigma-70 family)
MEVTQEFYKDYYHDKYRMEYLRILDAENCISYHYLDTEEFSGEEILVDYDQDVVEQVTTKLMIEKLRSVLPLLTDDEQALIQAIYFDEMSERDYAKKTGVYRNAIHKKKVRILEKLKNFLEN